MAGAKARTLPSRHRLASRPLPASLDDAEHAQGMEPSRHDLPFGLKLVVEDHGGDGEPVERRDPQVGNR